VLLPLHDGQTLPNLRPKSDAHQKQWLHRANWTCFEILPAFVVGPWSAIMVVVVVIVFNYTSPKFHKLVFSDYRQSRMHSRKIINIYLYFSISCSQTSISDTCLCCHCQTKVPKIKMIRCVWRIQVLALLRRSMDFVLFSGAWYFCGWKAYSKSKSHIEKHSYRACQESEYLPCI
jgi:hypothetical protein